MDDQDENVPVSDTDELTEAGGPRTDRTRKEGEYKTGNSPLSADEIERRRKLNGDKGWLPRTTENVDDFVPREDMHPKKK